MNKRSVAVMFGAPSSEYEVSLRSAYSVLKEIDKEKYIVYKIGVTKDGKWLLFNGEIDEILSDKWHQNAKNQPLCVDFLRKSIICEGVALNVDVIFPVMHGEYGEDGRIQALCELLEIKKVGVSCACASLCMDKLLCKTVAMRELVPVVPFISISRGEYSLDSLCAELGEEPYDVFVKPTLGGSSVGISHSRTKSELDVAIKRAFQYSDTVLVEEAIYGRECEVAILETTNEILVSEVGSLSYNEDFYDYKTKYHSSAVKYAIPAKIPEECRNLCKEYAKKLFLAFGCTGMSRVDFFVTSDKRVYFNEVNAIPGFTDISMYPMLMARSGYDMRELISMLIEIAR